MISLTKEEKEQIETVKRISESVLESYRLLMKLEIEGKINTSEYGSVLSCLLSSKELENNLLVNLYYSFKNVDNLLKYILDNLHLELTSVESLTKISEKDLPYRRLANLIAREAAKNKRPEDLGIEEITNLMFGISARNVSLLISFNDRDNLCFILNKLEEKINSPFYKEIRDNLIKVKYTLLYTEEVISELLDDKTKKIVIPNEIYFYGSFLADKLKIGYNTYQIIKKDYGIDLAVEQLHEILATKDYEYNIKENRVTLELREIFLRLALQLITPEEVTNSNQAFHEIIERDNLEDTTSAEFIRDAYRKYKNDQASIKTLTLKG